MINIKSALRDATGYLRRRPSDGWRIVRNALSLRILVPVEALRWGALRLGSSAVKDIAIREAPPGLRVIASVELMGTPLRAGATISVDEVVLAPQSLTVTSRIQNVELELLGGEVMSPVAALVKSGALDLSRPATLLAHMPKRPAMVIAAEGDTITLDLLKQPRLRAALEKTRLFSLVLQRVSVKSLQVRDGFIELDLGILPPSYGSLKRRWRGQG